MDPTDLVRKWNAYCILVDFYPNQLQQHAVIDFLIQGNSESFFPRAGGKSTLAHHLIRFANLMFINGTYIGEIQNKIDKRKEIIDKICVNRFKFNRIDLITDEDYKISGNDWRITDTRDSLFLNRKL